MITLKTNLPTRTGNFSQIAGIAEPWGRKEETRRRGSPLHPDTPFI